MQKTWNAINSFIRPDFNSNSDNINSIKSNNVNITDPTQISTHFNEYFTSIGQNIADTIDTDNNLSATEIRPPTNSFFFSSVNFLDVRKIIIQLKPKSCSIDTYPAKVIKALEPKEYISVRGTVHASITLGSIAFGSNLNLIASVNKRGALTLQISSATRVVCCYLLCE